MGLETEHRRIRVRLRSLAIGHAPWPAAQTPNFAPAPAVLGRTEAVPIISLPREEAAPALSALRPFARALCFAARIPRLPTCVSLVYVLFAGGLHAAAGLI